MKDSSVWGTTSEKWFYGSWLACLAASAVFAGLGMITMLQLLCGGILFWVMFLGVHLRSSAASFTEEFWRRAALQDELLRYQKHFGYLPEDKPSPPRTLLGRGQ